MNSSTSFHNPEYPHTATNEKILPNHNSTFQKYVTNKPFLQNISQQINSRSIKSNRIYVPDLNLPKKREIIINNIKTTIPKVNNFIGKQNLPINKETFKIQQSTEVKMIQDTKLRKKPKYFRRAGLTLTGSLAMFLLFDPMIQTSIK